MAQTSYPTTMTRGFVGMLSDAGFSQKDSKRNDAGAEVGFGLCVVEGSDDDSFTLPSADGDKDKVLGVTMHTHARETINGAGVAVADGARAPVLARGRILVVSEQDVALTDPVYVRHTANGAGKNPGQFRKDSDSSKAFLMKGARWVTSGSAGDLLELEIDANVSRMS